MRTAYQVSPFAFLLVFCLTVPAHGAAASAVEIQINNTPDPAAACVTWAPTWCRARLKNAAPGSPDVMGTLRNAATNTHRRVAFAAARTPWPANTTAAEPTLRLTGNKWRPAAVLVVGGGRVGPARPAPRAARCPSAAP